MPSSASITAAEAAGLGRHVMIISTDSAISFGLSSDLLKILRGFADEQRTVILTTHSMEYLDRVDRVMLLHDGFLVFSGVLPKLLAHFSAAVPSEVFGILRTKPAGEWLSRWVDR